MSSLDQVITLGERARAIVGDRDFSALTACELIEINGLYGQMRRGLEGSHALIASEIARQSRPEMGPDALAKQQGFRNPAALIAATTGTSSGDAARLLKVGEATTPRMMLSGETAPARHPHVAAALAAGTIGTAAASLIITMLDKVALRAGFEMIDTAEKTLAEQAPGLALDNLSRVVLRAEAWLDADGVLPREEENRAENVFHIREDRNGRIIFNGSLDAANGAPLKTAIEAMVSAEMRATQDARRTSAGADGAHAGGVGARGLDNPGATGSTGADALAGPGAPRRSVPQMQADALVRLAEHALACPNKDLPLGGITVVARMNLEDLINGTGYATIDGIAAPVSAATVRRMAADARIIPCVLGGDSEILDWGRAKRLFTHAQKLALTERDGGCAMCGAPPSHTKVHHIKWWMKDGGLTDLLNGLLLCEPCHHHIHDCGWDIEIDGNGIDAKVWFIPPAHVDPARTPRLGGRARFDFAA